MMNMKNKCYLGTKQQFLRDPKQNLHGGEGAVNAAPLPSAGHNIKKTCIPLFYWPKRNINPSEKWIHWIIPCLIWITLHFLSCNTCTHKSWTMWNALQIWSSLVSDMYKNPTQGQKTGEMKSHQRSKAISCHATLHYVLCPCRWRLSTFLAPLGAGWNTGRYKEKHWYKAVIALWGTVNLI